MNNDLNPNNLKEGEDFYYTPEGYKCFTEKYHLKRGYCCKSGCRHCPYGFDKKTGTTKKKWLRSRLRSIWQGMSEEEMGRLGEEEIGRLGDGEIWWWGDGVDLFL